MAKNRQRNRGPQRQAYDWIPSLQTGQLFSINPGAFAQFTLAGTSQPTMLIPGTAPPLNEVTVTRVQGHILFVLPALVPIPATQVVVALLAHVGFTKVSWDDNTGALQKRNPGPTSVGSYQNLSMRTWLHPIKRKYIIANTTGVGGGQVGIVAQGEEMLMSIDLPFNVRLGDGENLVMGVSNDPTYSNIAINFAMFLRVKVSRVA